MAARGVVCRESQVLLTNGAQQANELLARSFPARGRHGARRGGDVRLLPDGAAGGGGPAAAGADRLDTGMDVERVEAALRGGARPAFVYAIPDGHNPHGVSLSAGEARAPGRARRAPRRAGDRGRRLRLPRPTTRRRRPRSRALNGEWVVTIGSFSKLLAPGLRVGWIVASEALVARLALQKQANDLDIGTFTQRLVSAFLDTGELRAHLAALRGEYRTRRDAMARALRAHFPAEARFRVPAAGFYFWVELPARVDAGALLSDGARARARGLHPRLRAGRRGRSAVRELAAPVLLRVLAGAHRDRRRATRPPREGSAAMSERAQATPLVRAAPADVEDLYTLAPLQEGMLFHELLAPALGVYVQQTSFEIRGSLDVTALRRAWQETVDCHPVLRTAFVAETPSVRCRSSTGTRRWSSSRRTGAACPRPSGVRASRPGWRRTRPRLRARGGSAAAPRAAAAGRRRVAPRVDVPPLAPRRLVPALLFEELLARYAAAREGRTADRRAPATLPRLHRLAAPPRRPRRRGVLARAASTVSPHRLR
jgi:histidinol-phosphate/aromatic aminotransferase/cobyric acid decarboxylase-like protein